MRRREIANLPGHDRRGAYTLVELTVVIFIIVTLLALSAGAVIKFMAIQQRSNTQTTLDRTQAKLNKAWSAVKDQAYKEPIPANVQQFIMTNLAGSDTNATERMRVIYVKLRLRQVFPMSFDEALNNPVANLFPPPAQIVQSPVPAFSTYQKYLNNLGIFGSSASTAPYESSACLLMALQRSQSGSGVDTSDLTAGGSAGALSVTGGTLPYLTDAWGQPLHFARHPTGSILLNPNGPQPGNNDLGDPQGYLNSGTWGYGPSQSQTGCRNLFFTLVLQQPAPGTVPPMPVLSFKLAPMLGSAGPDRNFTTDPMTFAPTSTGSDDLFSTP